MKEKIKQFLIINEFKEIEPDSYVNDYCNVVLEDNQIAIANNHGDAVYNKGYCIYWTIGVLVYYGFISKNFIK